MSDTGNAIVKLLGGLLLGIGILIATVSGLCTLVVLTGSDGKNGMAGSALVIGGIPFVVGIALVFLGRLMLKGGPPSDPGTRA